MNYHENDIKLSSPFINKKRPPKKEGHPIYPFNPLDWRSISSTTMS